MNLCPGLTEPASIYVHVPFCRVKCTYCAFNVYTHLEHHIPQYVDAVIREMQRVSAGRGPLVACSLYLGGGTPSLLSPEQVRRIIDASVHWYGLMPGAEITLEVNPGTATPESLAAYRTAGVTRVSIGVQSAQTADLRLFGRDHTFAEAISTAASARQAGFENVNLDLIYGAPGQSLAGWESSLEAALRLEPTHLALYALTVELRTALYFWIERGRVAPPDPDLAAAMYDAARERLVSTTLTQYEISNWAQPGLESRHNRQYWHNRPFFGFGAGAFGAMCGVRYWNVRPVRLYIERILSGEDAGRYPFSPALEGFEEITRRIEMSETAFLGLRLVREGLSRAAFAARFGES
ncbi:MAG: radical SAM family heme chaperone HemW, partial [Anaerolineae bacterium]|nr:radical SAM family heme chaperone HemW [Anaerolineae bacterium]